jgi:spore maturation protein CgeB
MLRILFSGDNWYGSNARSCADGLRRLGCDVLDIDSHTFIPQVRDFTSRVVRRLLSFRLVNELNNFILTTAEQYRPDIFFAFKGNYIHASTLMRLSSSGIALYNYYPDTSAFTHGKWLPQSLPAYDCVFYTKPFWYSDVMKHIRLKAGLFLPHGYDVGLHRPVELSARDTVDYGCDVSFIATHTRYKEKLLEDLICLRPGLNLCIWGGGWTKRCESRALRRCIKGFPLLGERYVRAIQAARINLAIMSGPVSGASSGDLTTSRTYTIPASGGFMLHERNPEVLGLYKEGEEMACFDSARELAEKIDYYIAHTVERERVSQAGHARCTPSYSYDNRVTEILRWHFEHRGIEDLQMRSEGSVALNVV